MTSQPSDDTQAALWNGASGHAWVEIRPVLDQMFKPLEDLLVATVLAGSGRRVLDVGCGTGSTTLAIARALGAENGCVGIDISQPMIDVARDRAEEEGVLATFLCANAQTHTFEPAAFDTIVSRFGVMFFEDPALAFANLRQAMRSEAALHCIAWRSAEENPFMTTAERAGASLLPTLPARNPDAPGQFAFADPHRVRRILEGSGWVEIDIRAIDVVCTFAEKELLGYLGRLGPAGSALKDADASTRSRVLAVIRPAFDRYVHGDEVRFNAACWMISARSSFVRACG